MGGCFQIQPTGSVLVEIRNPTNGCWWIVQVQPNPLFCNHTCNVAVIGCDSSFRLDLNESTNSRWWDFKLHQCRSSSAFAIFDSLVNYYSLDPPRSNCRLFTIPTVLSSGGPSTRRLYVKKINQYPDNQDSGCLNAIHRICHPWPKIHVEKLLRKFPLVEKNRRPADEEPYF